jgi:hypothetical protein
MEVFYERMNVLRAGIRKDERTKHRDELIMAREGMRLETSPPFERTKAR